MNIQHELDRFDADVNFLDQHRRELRERYPNQWVAVYNQELVAVAADPCRLVVQLGDRGIPPQHVYHEFLATDPSLLVLPLRPR